MCNDTKTRPNKSKYEHIASNRIRFFSSGFIFSIRFTLHESIIIYVYIWSIFFNRTVHRFTYAKQIFGLNIWLKFIKATCAHIRIISNLLRWNNERKKTVEFAIEHLGVCCLLSWTIETTTTANVKYHKHNTYNKPPPKNSVTTLNVGARAKKKRDQKFVWCKYFLLARSTDSYRFQSHFKQIFRVWLTLMLPLGVRG